MSVLQKLTSEVLPKAVAEGRFGQNNIKFVEYKTDEKYHAADQFASSIYFGDVIMESRSGLRVTQSVVIKATAGGKLFDVAENLSMDVQLYNELLFYNELLPLFRRCDPADTITRIFPRCFYGHVEAGDEANHMLIYENVQKQGFKMSPWRTFNDYNHIKLTLEWLGKFHAISLVCKKKFPEELKRIVSKIRECSWTEKRLANPDNFYKMNVKRGILPLQNDPKYKGKLDDLLAVAEKTDLSMAKIIEPKEPFAVVCHGDFCRNNIFYKYDSNNMPCEVIFFDFATFRYSSPVIDISFYLFMNSSPEVRASHWEDILGIYHSALTSNPDLDPALTPSFEEFEEDFQRRGFYGYVHSSFYLPMMLSDEPVGEWHKLTVDELIKLRLKTGGEVATFYVTQLVKHMIDHNFDFKYISDLKPRALEN